MMIMIMMVGPTYNGRVTWALAVRAVSIVFLSTLVIFGHAQSSTTLVPAIITFGDSAVDVGNNNYLHEIFKADFPPYGREFINHELTGRFCNGKLATDIIAENPDFTNYAPAYLSPQASGTNLLIGTNFASAASGYYDETAILYHAIPLSQQLEYYEEYQSKLVAVAGSDKSVAIISQALYLLSAGISDYLQNYYINPYLYKVYASDEFSTLLVKIFSSFISDFSLTPIDLYAMGARRISVTSLPPLGCLPATITLFMFGSNGCIARINDDAQEFNGKINSAVAQLQDQLSGLKITVFDIYNPLFDLINNPSKHGFFEALKACCGTGTIEMSFLCNPHSPGTCSNATGYVFFDSVHQSQAANQALADSLILQGISLIS